MYVDGDVRLIGGSSNYEGRVEIWYENSWVALCDDNFGIKYGGILCQQLGYKGVESIDFSFGHKRGGIVLNDLKCYGKEAHLLGCNYANISHSSTCKHIGLQCKSHTS